MQYDTNQTPIIAQIQPCFDTFQSKIKQEKKRQGRTTQEIADATGIPISRLNKYLSGNITNANLYNAAAVSIYFGISIDETFGLNKQSCEENDRVKELETKLHDYEREMEYCRKDRENLIESLNAKKMIITVLFGVCIMLIASLGFGIAYDSALPDAGFIQKNHIATISIVLITVIILSLATTITIMTIFLYKKEKKKKQ